MNDLKSSAMRIPLSKLWVSNGTEISLLRFWDFLALEKGNWDLKQGIIKKKKPRPWDPTLKFGFNLNCELLFLFPWNEREESSCWQRPCFSRLVTKARRWRLRLLFPVFVFIPRTLQHRRLLASQAALFNVVWISAFKRFLKKDRYSQVLHPE